MSQQSGFCTKCGAALSAGSTFCHRCGAPVAAASTGPSPPPSWSSRREERRRERQEKHEKYEKQEKREKNEKGRGGDLAGALTGGLILILLGILFYMSQAGIAPITWGNFWEYFLIGLGAILIVQGLVRYAERGHLFPGNFIGGFVLLVIGLAFVSSNSLSLWPLILVVLGIGAIVSAFVGRARVPRP